MAYTADAGRFFSKTERQPNGCLYWTAGLHSHEPANSYGKFYLEGKDHKAHRVAWLFATGEWPTLEVCHTCDTPRCVAIEHLFVASHAENMRDCANKGRMKNHGVYNGRAKLTPDQVREIRSLQGEVGCVTLGRRYGVNKTQIARIWRREIWASVK